MLTFLPTQTTNFKGPGATPPNTAAIPASPQSSVIVEPGTPFVTSAAGSATTAVSSTAVGSSLKHEILREEPTGTEDVEMDG
jgi:hypothetical protein